LFTLPAPRDASRVYLLIEGATALFSAIAFTIAAVYYVTVARLDPLQLVLLGTALEVSYFLFEVPTGVLADTWSRRGSVIVGYLLGGFYFVILGLVPVFAVMLLANVVSGIGYTFISGALQAWIADEIGEEQVGPLYLRASQVGRVAALTGTVLSVALAATIGLGATIVVAGIGSLGLAGVLVVVMPEHGFRPAPREPTTHVWGAMAATARSGLASLRGRPLMLSVLLAGGLFGAFTEAFDRLWEAHLLSSFVLPPLSLRSLADLPLLRDVARFGDVPAAGDLPPIAWFGIINIAGMVIGLVVAELVRRRLDTSDPAALARALLVIHVALVGSIVTFGAAAAFAVAVGALLSTVLLRGLQDPLYAAWLNRGLDPSTRATVLSMAGQADALGQIGGGPVLGLVGSAISIRAALVLGGVVLAPAVLLYARVVRHGGRADDTEVTEAARA
jgi:DHA3 family tetracycline resistance protein-like MFS transporter